MATYCKNHVKEEVKELSKTVKGKITRVPTKEGMCGHIGGCITAHDDLYQLKYDQAPREEKPSKKSKAEKTAEGTTATEKPTEETPTTS